MSVICAWCECVMRRTPGPDTHGICGPCEVRVERELMDPPPFWYCVVRRHWRELKRGLRRRGLMAALLACIVVGPAVVYAQDTHPPLLPAAPIVLKPLEYGMSPWAFRFALAGQLADILTTETALAAGGVESNPLMRNRAVRVSTKLLVPVLARWAYKRVKLPRAQSNANAVIMGSLGFGPAAWNIYITVKLRSNP